MSISSEELYWALAIAFVLGGTLAYIFWRENQKVKKGKKEVPAQRATEGNLPLQLQLQAYERLLLLTERIALPNLINRMPNDGLNAREMQSLLNETIRKEFEHNITQQIYVSNEAWDAIRNLKEQNIYIVNQVSSFLPPTATALDLNKYLLEMIVQNPKTSLHGVVAEVLSFEAKKLLDKQ